MSTNGVSTVMNYQPDNHDEKTYTFNDMQGLQFSPSSLSMHLAVTLAECFCISKEAHHNYV